GKRKAPICQNPCTHALDQSLQAWKLQWWTHRVLMFDVLPQRGIDAWNAMIIVYSRKEYPVEVPCLYHWIIFGRCRT
ncbi:putative pentatricopeptide repeat-containing protein, partial [Quercus suber]